MLDHKWFDFAKVVVNEMACVKKNENLLILADTWTDLGVAELCFEAGRNIGAKSNLHVFPLMAHDDVSELDEILSLSDRILVMFEGQIMGEVLANHASEREIGLLMAGIKKEA